MLEPDSKGAIDNAGFNGLPRQEQGGGAGGAVVVDIDNRNAGHPDFIQNTLSAGAVAVDIARIGLLDLVIFDARIFQRHVDRLGAHDRIILILSRLYKGRHADARNDYFLTHDMSLSCLMYKSS